MDRKPLYHISDLSFLGKYAVCGAEADLGRGVGLGLSIARGALHPHLLTHGWRSLERKDGDPNCSAARSRLSFLCSRFSVGSNESRQQLHCPAVTQETNDGEKVEKEEKGMDRGGKGKVEGKRRRATCVHLIIDSF